MLIEVTRLIQNRQGVQPKKDTAYVRADDIVCAVSVYPDNAPPHTLIEFRGSSQAMHIEGDPDDLRERIMLGGGD